MSKKKHKKKKHTQRANHKPQPKQTKYNVLTPILIILVFILTAIAVYFGFFYNNTTNTEEMYAAIHQDASNYLQEKYGETFEYAGDASGGAMLFTNDKLDGFISVYYTSTLLQNPMHPEKDFTEEFADNGYPLIYAKEIEKYFETYIKDDLGSVRCMVYCDAMAYPSTVTKDTTAEDFFTKYDAYSAPMLFILTDKNIKENEMSATLQALENANIPMFVRVLYAPAEEQSQMFAGAIIPALPSEPDGSFLLVSKNFHITYE